ncbi:MAG TPA: patatin-like phospholipase family protein [Candidatus Acidoferrum sp.]|nr:patatin-like phospholipase family protein [Candidatus Acidoferrum sp.]
MSFAPRSLCALFAILLASVSPASACEPSRAALDSPVALVLSGGGAKGAWEAGAAVALIERGVPVSLVAGSSAGALNAAMLADGRLDRLQALWRSLSRDQVYSLRPSVIFAGLLPGWVTLLALDSAGSLFDPTPLRELIAGALDFERIRASPRRLLVITTDLARRVPRIFDNDTVSVDALMAAAAVPGAFPPVSVDGTLLVDGGLTGRAPVLEALATAAPIGRALVLLSYATDEPGQPPTRLRRTLEEAFETAMVHQIRRDAELARFKYPAVDVQLLTPGAPLRLRPLDFDPAGMAEALARGRTDALRCLERWQEARP